VSDFLKGKGCTFSGNEGTALSLGGGDIRAFSCGLHPVGVFCVSPPHVSVILWSFSWAERREEQELWNWTGFQLHSGSSICESGLPESPELFPHLYVGVVSLLWPSC
jgi:hypothetical protein